MVANLIVLYRLQQADKQLEEIQEEINSLQDLSKEKKELEEVELNFQKSQTSKREAEHSLKDAEYELTTLETEKKQIQNKLYNGKTTNPKELMQLEKDLEVLNKRRDKLDDRVLQAMDKIEKVEKDFKEKEKAYQDAKERLESVIKSHEEKREKLNQQLAELEGKRNSFYESLEASLLEKYAFLKERKGGLAVVKLSKNVCSGCFMLVSESSIQKVKVLELEYCSSCGRILYLDRES